MAMYSQVLDFFISKHSAMLKEATNVNGSNKFLQFSFKTSWMVCLVYYALRNLTHTSKTHRLHEILILMKIVAFFESFGTQNLCKMKNLGRNNASMYSVYKIVFCIIIFYEQCTNVSCIAARKLGVFLKVVDWWMGINWLTRINFDSKVSLFIHNFIMFYLYYFCKNKMMKVYMWTVKDKENGKYDNFKKNSGIYW